MVVETSVEASAKAGSAIGKRQKLIVLCALALVGAAVGCTKEEPSTPGSAAGTMALPTAGATAGIGGMIATGGLGGMIATSGVGGMLATGGVGGMTATGGVGGAMAGVGGMMAGVGGEAGAAGMGGTTGACSAPAPNATVGNACAGSAPPALKLTPIVSGLFSPTFMTQAPGDDTRFYVLEQRGTIRVVKDGALVAAPLMDLGSLTNAAGLGFYTEAGLLAWRSIPTSRPRNGSGSATAAATTTRWS